MSSSSSEGRAAIEPGATIAGRFKVEALLGSGGMAEVFRARDLATGKMIALKLLRSEIANNAEALARARREGEVLTSLKHPAIVSIETFGMLPDGRIFIAMEYLEGETLGARMRRRVMDPAELSPIVSGACAGLIAAHDEGVVHRDLKPDNIFLAITPGAQDERVKLLDFGISKVYGSDKLTQTGEILGTPRYMAPEQLAAERDIDLRVDVYAFGVILYEAMAGHPPFVGSTPTDLIIAILHGKSAPLRSFRPDLPPEIEEIVARAMARAREARFESAGELAQAFLDVASSLEKPTKQAPRAGMETNMLGSMSGSIVPSPFPGLNVEVRPGTFRELYAQRPAAQHKKETRPPNGSADATSRERAGVPVAHPPVQVVASPSMPASAGASMPVNAGVSMPANAGASMPVNAGAFVPSDSDSLAGAATTRPRMVLFFVVAALAGGLVAAITLALVFFGTRSSDEPPGTHASPSQPAPQPTQTRASAAQPKQSPGNVVHAAPSVPTVPEQPHNAEAAVHTAGARTLHPPDAGVSQRSTSVKGRAVKTKQRSRAHQKQASIATKQAPTKQAPTETAATNKVASAAGGSETGAQQPQSLPDLMREARAALARDDARTCVTLLERAYQPPASVLRLYGDCLVRAGSRAQGLRAYERFCRLSPDHPAIGEVRAVVESMGGSCN